MLCWCIVIKLRVQHPVFVFFAAALLAACSGSVQFPAAPTWTPPPPDPPELPSPFEELLTWDIELEFDAGEFETMLADPSNEGMLYHRATFKVGEDTLLVGARLQGSSNIRAIRNLGLERYSFRIEFDSVVPEQEWRGLDGLTLHNGFGDPSLIRRQSARVVFESQGIASPRSVFARLSVNGKSPSLYSMVELVDGEFLDDRFGEREGILIEAEPGDLFYLGDEASDYPTYTIQRGDPTMAGERLVEFIDTLNNTPIEELENAIDGLFDVDSYLVWLATNTLLANMDAYGGSAEDYYLYLGIDDRFVYIPRDTDDAFANYPCPQQSASELITQDLYAPICAGPRPLITRLLEVDTYRQMYDTELESLLDQLAEDNPHVQDVYRQAMKYELEFFDASIHSE